MKYRQHVRLVKYPKDHMNAYAAFIRYETGGIIVSNMNMPFMGTFANEFIPDGEWMTTQTDSEIFVYCPNNPLIESNSSEKKL